ncbi:MAG: ABC transporter substrate-binding protein [Alphaproteobacteria bacterium]|nr:ABC transporter substrate-binding protein [Alphaproteobacteria bacterium]
MKKSLRLFSSAAAIVALLVAPAHAAEKFAVMLDWFINPDHAPLFVALEKGYFEEAGLEVEFVEPADPNDPPKLVAAGKADLAVSYQPQLHIQINEGLPLVRVGTLVATPLSTLLVRADGPVANLADLNGRKVGFSIGGFEDAILKVMLEQAGLSLDDVELVNVNFSLSPSLLSGQVDAVIGAFRNFELNQMDIVGVPGKAFYPEENGVPPYDELILVANSDRRDDPSVSAFVRAVERGVQFLINHPDQSWTLFVSGDRESLDDELNRRAWRDTLPRFALRPAAFDNRRYEIFGEFLKAHGLITETPPVATYAIEPR